MNLSVSVAQRIRELLIKKVRGKLNAYNPETEQMPFHYRLLGRDRMDIFSFIQSINTTFGMSIWEQLAVLLATDRGVISRRQYKLTGHINPSTEELINSIVNDLEEKRIKSDKVLEVQRIKDSINELIPEKETTSKVDFYFEDERIEYYMEIKTAKPNKDVFIAAKRKLLKWVALRLSRDLEVSFQTVLAIPYNPYEPEPYARWTLKGMLDEEEKEILVGEEFWNFVARNDIYNDLLDQFQIVGDILRTELDSYFLRFKENN